jgi:transcriptional regulator with XRE-family HTH domain
MADPFKERIPVSLDQFRKVFGRNVAAARKAKGMTQEQLAHILKLDPVFIAYIEGAQRSPSFGTLYKLAKTLEVAPEKLFRV